MKIKQNALIGLMGLSSAIGGLNAQTPAKITPKLFSEIGVAGFLKQDMLLYRGANIGLSSKHNDFNAFFGATLNSDKKSNFISIFTNTFKWNKYSPVSTWGRTMFAYSKRVKQMALEVAPVRLNFSSGKFDFSFNPAAAVIKDFKNKTVKFGVNTIFQTIYSLNPKSKLFVEVNYHSAESDKIKNIKFNSPFDNTSYKVTYLRYF